MSGDKNRRTLDCPENERLYNDIECALDMMRSKTPAAQRCARIRCQFPLPVFFIESNAYVKRRVDVSHLEAFYFSMIPGIARYVVQEHYGARPRLNRLSLMSEYLVQLYTGIYRERFYAVLLDGAGRKIETALLSAGTTDTALFDLKPLLSLVVQRQARAVVLCHNHPRGTLRPSEEDVGCTLRAMKALAALGVPLVDHIIVAYHRTVSLRYIGAVPTALWMRQEPSGKLMRDWLDVELI